MLKVKITKSQLRRLFWLISQISIQCDKMVGFLMDGHILNISANVDIIENTCAMESIVDKLELEH